LTGGRFGPVFLATGPDAVTVVVRAFTLPLSDLQRGRLVTALTELCGRPLEHPCIARPISAGIEDGRPYLVHAFLPGRSLAELTNRGPLALPDAIVRLTSLAGALDFAEATGVLHGALSWHDVTFSASNAGVSGFGLVQALQSAGVPGFHAKRDDDVSALIGIARELLGNHVSPAVEAVLSGPLPPTALAFAAALQDTLPRDVPSASEDPPASPAVTNGFAPSPVEETLGRLEFGQETTVPAIEDLFHREAVPAAPVVDFELRGDALAPGDELRRDALTFGDPLQAEAHKIAEPAIDPRPMFGSDAAPAMFGAMEAEPVRPRGRAVRWSIVAVIALGLGGFGGFFVGRDGPVLPTAVAPPPPTAPAPQGTGGQNFTDAAADEPPAPASPSPAPSAAAPAQGPAVQPPARAKAPAGQTASAPDPLAPQPKTKAPTRTSRAQEVPERASGPAAMLVDSRPAGAQVFVDGRSVGYTPMVVSDLSPGTHSVRMQIPGYRPWVTAVTLNPGARERVAASLEQ